MVKIIKLFTMVKDEVDIVEDWLKYHGSMFGYQNLYVIDNFSTDGTYEILLKYKNEFQIFLIQEPDYKLKGVYMRHLIKDRIKTKYDIAYPIDIDEFIVYYDKNTNTIDPNKVVEYINSLPSNVEVFKANYIISLISNNNGIGYDRAAMETKYGKYADYGSMAKTFFNNQLWNGHLDHGNHYNNCNYYLSNLCLIHYHCRNLEQTAEIDKLMTELKLDDTKSKKAKKNKKGGKK